MANHEKLNSIPNMFSSKRGPTLGRLPKPNPYSPKKKKKITKTVVSQKPSEKPKTMQSNI
jgi:hypothetical protein